MMGRPGYNFQGLLLCSIFFQIMRNYAVIMRDYVGLCEKCGLKENKIAVVRIHTKNTHK